MPETKYPIRILHLEDSPRDAEIIQDKLETSDLECNILSLDSREHFEATVAKESFDLILCDYNFPGYDGFSALKLAREKQPNTPVIIISGVLGEEEAVKCLHLGATDYLLKQRLERLVPAIKRALQELEEGRRRRRAEVELRQSQALLQIAGRIARLGGWVIELPNYRVIWSDEVCAIHEEPPGTSPTTEEVFSYYPPEWREKIKKVFNACAHEGTPYDEELQIVTTKGRRLWVRAIGQAVRDSSGTITRVQGALQDITEQKEAEARIREQASLLDKAKDAIVVRGINHQIHYWNSSAERLYGWTAAEAIGRSMEKLLYEDSTTFLEATHHLLETGEWVGQIEQRHKDGRLLTVEAHWTLVRDDQNQPQAIFAINTDITERLALEEQLRQSQRLDAIGQLTGGIAHDFNNLLTVILCNAEILLKQLSADQHRHTALAEIIQSAALQGAELIRRLLAFARRQPLEPQTVDVNRLVSSIDGLLQRTLTEEIDIEIIQAEGLWGAFVDPIQLEAALLNLAINAKDAMERGGRLIIETENIWLDQEQVGVPPGQYIMITVSDTGTGIPAENLDRVFEPFFTTKEKGKGTGLGLSMIYGFVRQSQGYIKIYSEVGQGTTVKLYLPRTDWPSETIAEKFISAPDPGGSETVLVVEDDDLVRRHAESQLTELGYRVLSARNGPEAMEIVQETANIDLLFTDVIMPGGMNGRQLVEAATRLQPQLRVLYTSGFSEKIFVHHSCTNKDFPLLQKPYRRTDLAQKVREVLSKTQG
ncbi:response regulator [Nitrosococcus wardiae]|uniref:histidine kinase n=1 Tax=Nitrosococcus wardiae TaxID=1814290 RepID=A0A4P7BZG4_9GAMM|nr:response regulator [Nitrosococcus wardiae]QBQ55491.1 response regulator [Nitrosococcus wardiae]